jgi:cytochrome c oxidase subunit III
VAANTATAPSTSGPLAHHFNNMAQQHASVRFGMWLFLVTEVLFFGGALCAYTAYRIWYPKDFEAGSAALNVGIASVNTFLLLGSSLTITLAIRSCYVGDRGGLMRNLILTTLLCIAFLGLKAREYQLDYVEGLVPGNSSLTKEAAAEVAKLLAADPNYVVHPFDENLKVALHHADFKGEPNKDYDPRRVNLFFMFYYSLTGIHVLHMIVGLGLLIWQIVLTKTGFFDFKSRYVYIETMSLYWHFVDMVWMFLLPLLYLCGPHNANQAIAQFKLAIGLGSGH